MRIPSSVLGGVPLPRHRSDPEDFGADGLPPVLMGNGLSPPTLECPLALAGDDVCHFARFSFETMGQ
mgnify:CR=1 FL=1